MRTPTKEHARAERLRQHAAALEQARSVVGVMGVLVRGREARARAGDLPLEVEFARTDVDGRALPAAVWVALRREDVDAAIEAMTAASQSRFLIDEREEIGSDYRLRSVAETLPLPEVELLTAQLSRTLNVPLDVLTVIAEWGADDARAKSEIDELLTRRFGAVSRIETAAALPDGQPELPRGDLQPAEHAGRLTMTVAEVAQVLRLDDSQTRALTVLVRNAAVTLTA